MMMTEKERKRQHTYCCGDGGLQVIGYFCDDFACVYSGFCYGCGFCSAGSDVWEQETETKASYVCPDWKEMKTEIWPLKGRRSGDGDGGFPVVVPLAAANGDEKLQRT